ncbi:MAG: ATP-binding cassette domain-containing protein [Candidatus Eiseniibacteriota bacterium]|nr:MAG: ATP-binding cassette domain-containing protein [Candidatus Eisenbacteria bacterium]
MPEAVVKISDLVVSLGGETVLDLPSLEFEEGRVHVLVGPNGAGKTTLLRVVNGLQLPTSGSVKVFGRNLNGLTPATRLAEMRKMTLCFQKPYLFDTSVRRNVEYGLRFREFTPAEKLQRVEASLEALGLAYLQHRNARTLSTGEAQRVSLARAIALGPPLVLLDEPVASVDEANRVRVEMAIQGLEARGCTVVAVTHELRQAYRLSANVVRLERGRLAPPALENILEGEVIRKDGSTLLKVGRVAIHVITDSAGPVRAAIDPGAIIVSTERIESSARNCLAGKVTALATLEDRVAATVDVGLMLTAHVTKESFERLRIGLGSDVFLTFKASAVTVF